MPSLRCYIFPFAQPLHLEDERLEPRNRITSPISKGTWSEPNLHEDMFQPFIFRDVHGRSKSRQDVSEVNPPRASVRARAKSGPEFQVPPFIHTRTEIFGWDEFCQKDVLKLVKISNVYCCIVNTWIKFGSCWDANFLHPAPLRLPKESLSSAINPTRREREGWSITYKEISFESRHAIWSLCWCSMMTLLSFQQKHVHQDIWVVNQWSFEAPSFTMGRSFASN